LSDERSLENAAENRDLACELFAELMHQARCGCRVGAAGSDGNLAIERKRFVLVSERLERATDHDRDLLESVLKSYLTTLMDSDTMETKFPDIFRRPLLNVTYVPIANPLPDDFDQRGDQVAWIRNHYDYGRAFAFLTRLRALPGADTAMLGGTVWIVSCLHPLSSKKDPRPLLPENLTGVPVRVIPPVMRSFADQTTQPRDYNPYALARLALDLRITIAQLADGLQSVTAGFKVLGGLSGDE